MHSKLFHFKYSPVALCTGVAGLLAVVYIGLIAVVMSYAALTIEFSQSVRNDETAVAKLESRYLEAVAQVTALDYSVAGYAKPIAETFVATKGVTALR